MTASCFPHLSVSRIGPDQRGIVETFFDRLDEDSLSARFGMPVTRQFLHDYSERLALDQSVLIGAFEGGYLLGIAELHALRDPAVAGSRIPDLELAVAVDRPCQSKGVGTLLARNAIQAAFSLAAAEVHACFDQHNLRMRRIALNLGMMFLAESGFVIASLPLGKGLR